MIIVEKICGNIKHIDSTALKIDEVKIEWFDSYKKIARLTSQGNKLIGLKLTKTSGLNDGDILALENSEAIVVSIIPTSAFAWVCTTWEVWLTFAMRLGISTLLYSLHKIRKSFTHPLNQWCKECLKGLR